MRAASARTPIGPTSTTKSPRTSTVRATLGTGRGSSPAGAPAGPARQTDTSSTARARASSAPVDSVVPGRVSRVPRCSRVPSAPVVDQACNSARPVGPTAMATVHGATSVPVPTTPAPPPTSRTSAPSSSTRRSQRPAASTSRWNPTTAASGSANSSSRVTLCGQVAAVAPGGRRSPTSTNSVRAAGESPSAVSTPSTAPVSTAPPASSTASVSVRSRTGNGVTLGKATRCASSRNCGPSASMARPVRSTPTVTLPPTAGTAVDTSVDAPSIVPMVTVACRSGTTSAPGSADRRSRTARATSSARAGTPSNAGAAALTRIAGTTTSAPASSVVAISTHVWTGPVSKQRVHGAAAVPVPPTATPSRSARRSIHAVAADVEVNTLRSHCHTAARPVVMMSSSGSAGTPLAGSSPSSPSTSPRASPSPAPASAASAVTSSVRTRAACGPTGSPLVTTMSPSSPAGGRTRRTTTVGSAPARVGIVTPAVTCSTASGP